MAKAPCKTNTPKNFDVRNLLPITRRSIGDSKSGSSPGFSSSFSLHLPGFSSGISQRHSLLQWRDRVGFNRLPY